MRNRTLAFVIVLAALAGPRAAQAQIVVSGDGSLSRESRTMPTGTGLLMGRTIDPGTNQPVPGVVVSLYLLNGPSDSVMTDSSGRFVFRSLPAGSFSFFATKSGYVIGKYGKHLPDTGTDVSNDSTPVTLANDERRGDILIKMWKLAAIGGTVRDEHGDPVVGVMVRALPVVYTGGRKRVAAQQGSIASQNSVTDDRGMFRVSSLIPSDYVVVVPIVTNSFPRSLQRLLATPGTQPPPGYTPSTYGQGWTNGGGIGSTALDTGDARVAISTSSALSAGDSMAPIVGLTKDGRVLVYETQYFPGVSSVARATRVTLGSGEERSNVDFNLRPVPTMRVSGTVIGPDGPLADTTVRLVSKDTELMTSDPDLARTVTDVDGTFVFPAVAPGEYTATVRIVPRPRLPPARETTTVVQTAGGSTTSMIPSGRSALPSEATLWADRPIVVSNDDVSDVTLTLQLGPRVTGRLEFQGSTPPPVGRVSSFYLERADGTTATNLGLLLGRVDPQGNLSTSGQPPGKYYVRVPYTVQGWHLTGAMLRGRDVSISPLEIAGAEISDVVITFSDKPGASISGVVRADRGAVDFTASVVVFPVSRETWGFIGQNPPDYRSVGVLGEGKYLISDLPAGNYFVAAIPASRKDWCDPVTLEVLARTATRVQLAAGQPHALDLTVTAARSGDHLEFDLEAEHDARGHGPSVDDDQAQAPPRDSRPTEPVGSGVIAGVVESVEPREPLRRTQVTLSGAALVGNRFAITDEQGRFSFAGVPAGRFTLSAAKPAYLTATYGASRPGRPGTVINLTDGQRMSDITLVMTRGAVITGTVRDPQGQPVSGGVMEILQFRTTNGERRLVSMGVPFDKTTDDRGVYRYYGLQPGDYFIAATSPRSSTPAREVLASDVQFAEAALKRGAAPTNVGTSPTAPGSTAERARTFTFAPVFYPGTADPTEAVPVNVAAGKDATGIDFVFRPVPAVSIKGIVTSSVGPLPSNLDVRLLNTGQASGLEANPFSNLPVRLGPNGTFSFSGVVPGRYVVVVAASTGGRGGTPSAGPMFWAQTDLVVAGADITNVAMTLEPGMTVTGSVAFDATTLKSPALDSLRVSLGPMLGAGQVSVSQGIQPVAADGAFTIAGVTPGRYLPRPVPPAGSTGWVVRGATLNGRDVMDEGFEVRAGENVAGLTVTYTDRTTEISGALQDASGRPAPDYFIIAFTTDKTLWRSGSRRIQQVRPASDGRFSVKNLPAGSYYIAALTDVAPNEWFDAAFLTQLVPSAVQIGLAEGEKKAQNFEIRK